MTLNELAEKGLAVIAFAILGLLATYLAYLFITAI
jgi:hypothetical protein